MKNVKIFFPKGDRHDATIYYVNIIKKALERLSHVVEIVDHLKETRHSDIVVVVNAKAHLQVLLYNCINRPKIICWYQGIMPEELIINYKKRDLWVKFILWRIFEYVSLRLVNFSIFVSDEMRQHYKYKYNILAKNFYIMPCFNQELSKDSFYIKNKYLEPTFLYAGTMSKWQCIDEMLEIYEQIEAKIKNSKLFIYTPDQKIAQEYIQKFNIKNVSIRYLPYDKLSSEIKKYKYGFLIRENIQMNRVATPTKMNTYLANGIIPIYSDCISAFKDNLSRIKFRVVANDNLLETISNFENEKIKTEDILNEYNSIFSSFYSENYHVAHLTENLSEIFS